MNKSTETELSFGYPDVIALSSGHVFKRGSIIGVGPITHDKNMKMFPVYTSGLEIWVRSNEYDGISSTSLREEFIDKLL
jgi:hypothetical protein